MRRGALATAIALLASTWSPGQVVAAAEWSLVMVPLTTTALVSTTYTITVTGLSIIDDLGCATVDVPVSFVIENVGAPVASDGGQWAWTQVGNSVDVRALDGGNRLGMGESLSFTIQALATQVGIWAWDNHAHRNQDCNGNTLAGTPINVTVLPGLPATLAPTPAPTPTLPPSATPTPRPSATATSTPAPTGTPRPGTTPQPGAIGGTTAPTDGAGPVGRIAELGDAASGSIGLGNGVFALLDGPLVWFVPGAAVGVPGLLVLLWIGLQAAGALAWIPAVRRMGGAPVATRRRRRRPDRA